MLKQLNSLVVYHVTLASNASSILENGIDPSYSSGKMQVSWYVSKHRIEWAVLHLSLLYHVLPEDLCICACCVEPKHLSVFMQPGRYYSKSVIHPESVVGVMEFFFPQGEIDNGQ